MENCFASHISIYIFGESRSNAVGKTFFLFSLVLSFHCSFPRKRRRRKKTYFSLDERLSDHFPLNTMIFRFTLPCRMTQMVEAIYTIQRHERWKCENCTGNDMESEMGVSDDSIIHDKLHYHLRGWQRNIADDAVEWLVRHINSIYQQCCG